MLFTMDNVGYAYSRRNGFHLGPFSLSIEAQKITALVGSNGSGKTTLIRILIQELVKFTGEYRVDNIAVRDLTGGFLHRFGIGYAPENPVLDEKLSGYETLSIIKEMKSIDDTAFAEQVLEFRKYLQLGSWFDTVPCEECSQGMRRKISLTVALLCASSFLIIDEPTNGLDPLAVFGLKQIMSTYAKKGRGVLVSSHMLDFVEKIAEQIIILKDGALAYAGTVSQLLENNPGNALDEIYYDLFTSNLKAVPGGSL